MLRHVLYGPLPSPVPSLSPQGSRRREKGESKGIFLFLLFSFSFLLFFAGPAGAADVRATLGMERDDNLFKAAVSPLRGWVSRFTIAASGALVNRPRGRLTVDYQGGMKRFWARRTADGSGEVMTNDIAVSGQGRVAEGVTLSGAGGLKVKSVSRISGEDGYLRGSAEAAVTVRPGRGFSGAAHYRRGGDDSRSAALPDASLHEGGLEARYGRSRRLEARAGVTWRWLRYGRPALEQLPGGGVGSRTVRQADLFREAFAGVQGYRGVLYQFTYAFVDDRSNSFGYGFRGHRLQGMLTRHLAYEVDGQVYVTFQVRRYDDPLTPSAGGRSEADEYEQTVAIFKLSRQVTSRCGVSVQYRRFRNGARQGDAFYRKHVYGFSVDASL